MEYTMTPPPAEVTPSVAAPTVAFTGFWRRFVSYILDAIIMWVVFGSLELMFGIKAWQLTPSPEEVSSTMGLRMVFGVLSLASNWLYFTMMESSKYQGTVGKIALSLRVTDLEGNRISFGRANGRYWSKILSFFTLCIGFMMIGWTKKKQGLHDMIANTVVLRPLSSVSAQVATNAFGQ